MDDLQLGYEALATQGAYSVRMWKYYKGKHPLKYSAERLNEVFGRTNVDFVQTWCSVVVNTTYDRLVFKGFDSEDKGRNARLDEVYRKTKMKLISNKVHKDVLITGNGYIMFDLVDGEAVPYYNKSDTVVVIYDDADPSEKYMAVKHWVEDGINRMNLYYSDRIEKYIARGEVSSYNSYILDVTETNPFKRIPVVHFSLDGELTNVLPIQDAINKTFSDLMVTGEFAAFPQRWMITNANLSKLKMSPQSFLQIPKGAPDEEGTQIGSFEPADLGQYLETIDKLANFIAVISNTPKHYFANTGSAISGEALQVMEAPLVKKVSQDAEWLTEGWLEVASYYEDTEDVSAIWGSFETEQASVTAKAMREYIDMGVPLVTVCRRFGWGQDEIEQMLADMEEDKKRRAELTASALELAELRFAQSNNPYSNTED